MKAIPLLAPSPQDTFLKLTPADFADGGAGWGLEHKTLSAGLSQGVHAIEVNNGALRFTVLPTRGLGLWKAWLGDWEIGWQSPVRGPVHPAFVNLGEPSGLGWLDGFDELLVRCGLTSNGAPEFHPTTGQLIHPLHGRIANRPAHEVVAHYDADTKTLSITGVVEESRFHITRLRMRSTYRTVIGSSRIEITDEVENYGGTPAECQLLYHINIGPPVLEANAMVHLPFRTLVPRTQSAAANLENWNRYPAPTPGSEEHVYFFDCHADANNMARALLHNATATRGVSVEYDTTTLPCFSLWKDPGSLTDGYVTGLEPATNYPNPRSFEGQHQRVARLVPGESVRFRVVLEFHDSAASVTASREAIEDIASGQPRQTHATPQPSWCA